MSALSDWLALVLDELAQTGPGWVVTEAEADDLLIPLKLEFIAWTMVEMAP